MRDDRCRLARLPITGWLSSGGGAAAPICQQNMVLGPHVRPDQPKTLRPALTRGGTVPKLRATWRHRVAATLSKGHSVVKKLSLPGLVGASLMVFAVLPGAAGVGAGSVSAQSTGTTFLAASNTEPAFDFMTQDFVQTANGGNSVTFSFAGSGHLAGELDGGVDLHPTVRATRLPAMPCSHRPMRPMSTTQFPQAPPLHPTRGRCRSTATANASTRIQRRTLQQMAVITTARPAPASGRLAAQYTTGRLAIVSCRKGGKTLAPAQGAPTCAEPVSGYFAKSGLTEAPYTMAQVWSDLLTHTKKSYGGTAAHNVGGYLAIADPKNGWVFATTGCGPSLVAPNAPYGLAGMEALYVAATQYYHANPDKALGATASDQACAEIDRMTDKGSSLDNYNTTSPSSGGQNGNGNYSDPSLPIIFGDNVGLHAGQCRRRHLADSASAEVVRGLSRQVTTPTFGQRCPNAAWPGPPARPVGNGWTTHIASAEPCTDSDYVAGMHDNVAARISSGNFGKDGMDSPKTLVGEHGYYQPIRQWVVVENDDQGQSAATDLTSADGKSALAFIQYLLSAKGQAVLAAFGYDPIS